MSEQKAVKAWQINRAEPQPEWTHVGGELDLDVQCFADGNWLVHEEGDDHVRFMDDETYQELYGGAS